MTNFGKTTSFLFFGFFPTSESSDLASSSRRAVQQLDELLLRISPVSTLAVSLAEHNQEQLENPWDDGTGVINFQVDGLGRMGNIEL